MDIQLDTGPVIPSPALDSTIACNEVESLPACDVCKNLSNNQKSNGSLCIRFPDYEKTKDNCPSCALLWTISAPYHSVKGSLRFETESRGWLQMYIFDSDIGYFCLRVFTTTGMSMSMAS